MKTQGKVWVLFDTETKSQSKPMSIVQAQVILLTFSQEALKKILLWTPGWEQWQVACEYLISDQTYFAIVQPPMPGRASAPSDEPDTVTKTLATHTHSHVTSGTESPFTKVELGRDPLKHEEIGGYYFQDFNGDDLDLKKIIKEMPKTIPKKSPLESKPVSGTKPNADRRQDPRHNFKIEVVLVSKIRSFRTYSMNISISGTMLADEIPKDFLGQPFDLIIVNPFDPNPQKGRLLFKAKIVGDLTDPRRLMFIEQDVEMTKRLNALLNGYVTYQDQMKKSSG